jgi:hypothetical protein
LFRFRGAHIGLIPYNHLRGLVVWRVAPRAELLVNAVGLLTKSLLNYLVEGAAGVGYRLLIGGVAGAATLAGRGAAETGPFVKLILISIIVVTATLPSGTVREWSYDGEVAIVGVVETSFSDDALPIPKLSLGWTALLFFRQRERLHCRLQLVRPDFGEDRVPPHANWPSVQLNVLLRVHILPINVVVYHGSSGACAREI